MDTIIETVNLTRRYGRQTAVMGLNLQVKKGEIFGFLGPNGAGKTTTLLMLLGLSRPTEGTATVCGLDPVRMAREVKRLVGYLPENVGFYREMDAVQSLEYVASLNGFEGAGARKKIEELLDLVGLGEESGKKTAAFSRGMKQRLGVAEVLIKDPQVLFLDEPTLGLDPEGAVQLINLIQTLNREKGMTVLLSSHNLHQVQKISHRVGIMIDGKLIAEGSIDSLAEEKFGLDQKEYSLEEIYMKYFQEV
ncbi:MAG: ABC transporter ATP-binding protein [Deltaproteobacteria bacterium]|nr:ABC transporter ATP-binding protein [Deltaproteobacteria bacterium]MBW2047925.1 ABC transporter ATP-binding protein [Deltaproteobacteria bacterium]MBW2113003.1 ABC transporter ATP-binding protein [Deltaproteobacteria bacterium]MBW2352971.1 ABC transporter ATP-binding protein [Deltaproteobacteria bacterium]